MEHFSTTTLYSCPFPDTNSTLAAPPSAPPCAECHRPEYVVFTWILCLVALTSIRKLYFVIKTFLALMYFIMFCTLLFFFYDKYFQIISQTNTM